MSGAIRKALFACLAAAPLAACATVAGAGDEPQRPGIACPQTRGWNAWINAMPGPGAVPTLAVTGEADVPEGMTVSLRPGPLDRMMPPAQRFILSLTPGEGPSGWQTVRANIAPASGRYGAVVISCAGQEIGRVDQVGVAY